MSQPSDTPHNPVETIEFNRTVKGTPLERYWSAIGHAEKMEKQRDAAREDAESLAEALRKTGGKFMHKKICTPSACYCQIGIRKRALAAHEALITKP